MKRHHILSGLLVVLLAFSLSAEAWARAGKSSSMGSRGSRTYDRPMERSVTPPPATPAPGVAQPGAQQPMYNPNAVRPNAAMPAAAAPAMAAQPGFFQRNPIMGGIMGGLIGAGIGSMLFGSNSAMAAASGAAPMASMFGTLLQVALIGGLIWMGFRLFRRRTQTAGADMGAPAYQREAMPGATGNGDSNRVAKEFEVSDDDQNQFSRIIEGVQKAWSDGNPVALRQLVTPEVAGWIGEDLARDQANGVRNVVEDVTLLKGDISETWSENGMDYATAIITFSARDYMVRLSDNEVVEGDPRNAVETTEAWTFVRGAGGTWVLSAIEQM
ncbi:Tim44 domain-containing protein [Magnetospirillum gryphiswaldense]|uniref:Mitochondrial import inner membrane translocase, subunit Tim44 n=1 Tax=Magnetospirillum gryphiswaldense TaxID=55518 RepID=A4TU98_9PROT|nr:TIM44-like domain-containing protein [Magnetospirillum gryphiswaldense]AVM73236.1 Tim44-like domain protein [Magnetospirillum gryphiswaldense MSR-1]AVM77139.1 Tim44-like domain protein [Magnetospirillum gryphiswaldense]CAM74205.1 Mitochondrial import inner membrane translocase, subunit Tim44 [Magnetospirillum gryphiswaldense MSR-1]